MKYFKTVTQILIVSIFVFYSNLGFSQKDEIQVIGIYAHWETSMCVQGCVNIDLAHYQLIAPLEGLPYGTTNKIMYVKGKFKTVENEYVVAGANPDVSLVGKTYKIKKIEVEEYEEVDFLKIDITPEEKAKKEKGATFNINFDFSNPTKKDIDLKVKINDAKFQEFTLPASGSTKIRYLTEINDFNAYEILVVNASVGDIDSKKAFKKAESKGIVVHYTKTLEFE